MKIALDSGAFSLFHQKAKKGHAARGTMTIDHDFYSSAMFKEYLDRYIEYLCESKDLYSFYVTIDAIYNPQKTWEITEYIRSYGLNPMPVVHYGVDMAWVKKHMKKTDYIGIGGVGRTVSIARFLRFGDQIFKTTCNSKGIPQCKVHGFGVASVPMMSRYPWESVDSTSAFYFSRHGDIIIPKAKHFDRKTRTVQFDFFETPQKHSFSDRRARDNKHHVGNLRSKGVMEEVLEATIKQILPVPLSKLRVGYRYRDALNFRTMLLCTEAISQRWSERLGKEHNIIHYVSGKPGSKTSLAIKMLVKELSRKVALKNGGYLGTFHNNFTTQHLLKGQ